MLLIKVNTGKAIHVGKEHTNAHGVYTIYTHCGSERGAMKRPMIRPLNAEVTADKITCKKCLKAFETNTIRELV